MDKNQTEKPNHIGAIFLCIRKGEERSNEVPNDIENVYHSVKGGGQWSYLVYTMY